MARIDMGSYSIGTLGKQFIAFLVDSYISVSERVSVFCTL
jgi:hypothetical protein